MYHEVPFGKADLVCKTSFSSVSRRPLNLIIVIIQADNVGAGKGGDFARRATDAAANVEDSHAVAQTHHVREVVLVPSNGLVKAFVVSKAAKVKRGAPAVFV